MTKIKITQQQYNAILLNEQKRLLSEDEKPKYKNQNEVILAFSMLMGISLSGLNRTDAEKALKQESCLDKINAILSSKEKLSTMVDDLKTKGKVDAKDELLTKKHVILKNFREAVNELGLDIKLSPDVLKSFNELK